MKKIIFYLLIIQITVAGFMNASAAPFSPDQNLNLNSPSYILIDPASGQVLYEHNADAILYPASTTKIMTAILTIEHGDLDRIVTATPTNIDPGDGGANIGIMAGEELSVRDLLNAMLIKSANETANILAESVCETRQEFVDLMNKRAAELGATHTHFVTTNGMHDPNHYTTVRDMSKIAQYAMTLPLFREVVRKTRYQMTPTNKHPTWDTLYTTNQLMTDPYFSSENYDVIGIKTGYTGQADNNLVSAAVGKDGTELLAVVYGVKRNPVRDLGIFGVSKALLEYGFQNYAKQKVIDGQEVIKSVSVQNALREKSSLNLITSGELDLVLPKNSEDWHLEKTVHYISDAYKAPIRKNQVMGTIDYNRDGVTIGTVNIVAAQDIEEKPSGLFDKIGQVLGSKLLKNLLVGILVVLSIFFLLRFFLRRASRAVRARRRIG